MNKDVYRLVLIIVFLSMTFQLGRAQYPNIQVNNPLNYDPEEVTIAINPTNPQNLAAGANLKYYYYSTDGGQSWIQGQLSSSLGVYGDPCVNFDGEGNLYFGHLSNPVAGSWLDRIVVQKSENGGATWSGGSGIGLDPPKDQDKEWLVADMTQSAFRNNLYISWTEFDQYGSSNPLDSTRILFSRSTDFGVTWSTPVRVSDHGGDALDGDNTVEGAVPAVGPQGEVYISWSGPLGIMFDKSLDGGVTFGRDIFVSDQPGGWDFAVSGIYRCNGLPITLCDVSSSPFAGTIYVVWSDQRNGTTNTDVFMKKSSDGGQTWSDLKVINDDSTSRHQFFPWATVDPATGNLYVVFYDRRNTSGDATDVFAARSTDGGESFQNFQVSVSSFTPDSLIFFGDYINIAALDGMVYPIWMRMVGGDLSVWTAIIDDTPFAIAAADKHIPGDFQLLQNYPNPFNNSTRIEYFLPSAQPVTITIYDILGNQVQSIINQPQVAGSHSVDVNAAQLASGVYYYTLRAGAYSFTRKMVLLK